MAQATFPVESAGQRIEIGVSMMFIVLVCLAVTLRILAGNVGYSAGSSWSKRWRLGDCCVVVCGFLSVLFSATVPFAVVWYGHGLDSLALYQVVDTETYHAPGGQLEKLQLLEFIRRIFWLALTHALKLIILGMYWKKFGTSKLRFAVPPAAFVVVSSYTARMALTFKILDHLNLFWTWQFDTKWNSNLAWQADQQKKMDLVMMVEDLTSFLTNLTVFVIPLHHLWTSSMSSAKRSGMGGLFFLGFTACMISFARVIFNFAIHGDISLKDWQSVILQGAEACIGFAIVCAPAIWKLLRGNRPMSQDTMVEMDEKGNEKVMSFACMGTMELMEKRFRTDSQLTLNAYNQAKKTISLRPAEKSTKGCDLYDDRRDLLPENNVSSDDHQAEKPQHGDRRQAWLERTNQNLIVSQKAFEEKKLGPNERPIVHSRSSETSREVQAAEAAAYGGFDFGIEPQGGRAQQHLAQRAYGDGRRSQNNMQYRAPKSSLLSDRSSSIYSRNSTLGANSTSEVDVMPYGFI